MKVAIISIILLFNVTSCRNTSSIADSRNFEYIQCTELIGKYEIANKTGGEFAYVEIKSNLSLNFEVGVVDNYQPLMDQDVSYSCSSNISATFKFNDGNGNDVVGVFKRAEKGMYLIDFDVIGEFREDMGNTNIKRNLTGFMLKKIRHKYKRK